MTGSNGVLPEIRANPSYRHEGITLLSVLAALLLPLLSRASDGTEFHLLVRDTWELRQFTIDEVWSGDGLPFDSAVTSRNVPYPIASVPNLYRVDQLIIDMENDFVSRPHVFRPLLENNRLALVHQGHSGYTLERYGLGDVVRALVGEGYTVVGFLMPGKPPNTLTHNTFPSPTDDLNYLRYFVEPVVRTMNYFHLRRWELVGMTGISGGGWTATLAPAIDDRIRVSVPIASSVPLYTRQTAAMGDWEQQLPGLYPYLGYLDLHLLSVTGGRMQVQLLNRYDSCCFNYKEYSAVKPYSDVVADMAPRYGGVWQLVWDDTHRAHKISDFGRMVVLETFNRALHLIDIDDPTT